MHAESERVFVKGTLAAGDTVVVEGLQRLVPGQRVRLAGDVARNQPRTRRSGGADTSVSLGTTVKTTRQEGVR